MFDAKSLLDQFLGGPPGSAGDTVHDARQKFGKSPLNSFGGGAAVGGMLGLLLGGRPMRKMAGGALGYGGAAVPGALALRLQLPAPLRAPLDSQLTAGRRVAIDARDAGLPSPQRRREAGARFRRSGWPFPQSDVPGEGGRCR